MRGTKEMTGGEGSWVSGREKKGTVKITDNGIGKETEGENGRKMLRERARKAREEK